MNSVEFIQEAIRTCQSKSQLLMFNTLLMQTIGFGKLEDDLSDSRLEVLSGLRRDHATKAVREVLALGLFEVAGEGKYGTVYRIPERFTADGAYVGLSIFGKNTANTVIGQSETDAYHYPDDQDGQAQGGAYEALATELQQLQAKYGQAQESIQALVNTNQNLAESNRVLAIATQDLVKANQLLVSNSPSLGRINQLPVGDSPSLGDSSPTLGGPPKFRVEPPQVSGNPHRELVTDINKPLHNLTTTTLNPDSEGTDTRAVLETADIPEAVEFTEFTSQRGGRDAGIQAWAEYASQAAACKPLGQVGQVGAFKPAGGMMASLAAQASGHCQPASQAAQHQPDAAGMGRAALQYPEALNAEELAQAPRKLDGLHPTMAQEVLDALAAKIAAGGVKSNIGMLVHLARTAREGTFDRTPALGWRKRGQVVQASELNSLKAELRGLASEIAAYQTLLKASNGTDTATAAKIGAMKAAWHQKSAACKAMEAAQGVAHG